MNSSAKSATTTSLLGLYRQIWQYADGMRGQYVAAMSLLTASQLIKLSIPWLAAQAIDTIQLAGTDHLPHAALLVGAILLVSIAAWVMHGPGRILERNVGLRVREGMADALYARLTQLPLGWHEGRHSGEVQHRVQQSTGALYDFSQSQFVYLQNLVNIIGPLVALMLLSRFTGTLALAGFVIIGIVILRFDRVLMRLAASENNAQRRYTSSLLDFLGNISTVLTLRLATASRKLLGQRLRATFEPLKQSIAVNEAKWCAVELLTITLCWLLVGLYAWKTHVAQPGTLLLGSVFMVYQYAQQAAGVISTMASNFQNFAHIRTNVASAAPIWDATTRSTTPPAIAGDWRQIAAQSLSFVYQRSDGERGGIMDVSLTLARGERIALVGASGAGKSTVLRLLAGLYDPQSGRYLVDGQPVSGLGAISTLIPQEAEVFDASVRDNLTFGTEHPVDDLNHAAYLSAFDSVVTTLPQGYDTPISERGFNLSGGQRQRLALARGFLAARDSRLILLDEPTSALDPVTEGLVLERLHAARPDACIVASIHRMNLLTHFDRVVLMAQGRIVDQGSPAALAARQPSFSEMLIQVNHKAKRVS